MKQVPIFQILLSSLNSTCIMKHNMVDLQVPVYSDMCIGAISMFCVEMNQANACLYWKFLICKKVKIN